MTRRDALAAIGVLVSAHVGALKQKLTLDYQAIGTLTFGLNSYTAYIFTLGDRRVTVSPEEIMDALTHEHRPLTGMMTGIDFNGRKLEVCADCGQTYWLKEQGR